MKKTPKTPEKYLAKARVRADEDRRSRGVPRRPTFDERLEQKTVAIPFSGCVIWTGYINKTGYGETWRDGARVRVHRAVWERAFGPIPDGLDVLHRCDVPCCVSIHHLSLGTHQDNMADMVAKGRNTMGERHPFAKLTDQQVEEIRSSRKTLAELSEQYGIAISTASQIRLGQRWKHVQTAA